MKKLLSLFLILVTLFSLCACGKSNAVKHVEALIAAIGEVSLGSKDTLAAVRTAYDALTAEDRENVENLDILITAEAALDELEIQQAEHEAVCAWLVGEWIPIANDMYEYSPVAYSFAADGTFKWGGVDGTWLCDEDTIMINAAGLNANITKKEVNGLTYLDGGTMMDSLVREGDIASIFEIVELTDENISNYVEFRSYEIEYVDAFGEGTGYYDCGVATSNKVYNAGLVYWDSKDIAIEVFFPKGYYASLGDTDRWSIYAAGSNVFIQEAKNTVLDEIFNYVVYGFSNGYNEPNLNFHPESLSFGRAKGTIVFVKEPFVSSISNKASHSATLIFGLERQTGYWCNGVDWPENILA